MAFEQFNQSKENLGKYYRPEDALETPAVVEVNQRERAFNAEGGFKDLLRLKIVLEDLIMCTGMLRPSYVPDYVQRTIENPKKYAVSNLGLDDREGEEISEEDLSSALERFLKREKAELVLELDNYLKIITIYEVKAESNALLGLKNRLEDCKRLIVGDNWREYSSKALQAQAYALAMKNLLEISCGYSLEGRDTRKVVGASDPI
jgi:hypothetical protein